MNSSAQKTIVVFGDASPEIASALNLYGVRPVFADYRKPLDGLAEWKNADLSLLYTASVPVEDMCRRIRATTRGAVVIVLAVGGSDDAPGSGEQHALDGGADAFVEGSSGSGIVAYKVATLLGSFSPRARDNAEKITKTEPVPDAERDKKFVMPPVAPKPAADDAIKAALAAADAIVLAVKDRIEEPTPALALPAERIEEAQSLRQVIDQVEKQITADPLQEEVGVPPFSGEGGLDRNAAASGPTDATQHQKGRFEPEKTETPSSRIGQDRDVGETEEPDTDAKDDSEDAETKTYFRDGEELSYTRQGLRIAGEMRSRGDLKTDRLWTLLIAAWVDKRTGILTLLGGNSVERTLHISDGDIVMATSSARDDRLVELLFSEGRLTSQQYDKAAMAIGSSGRRAGAILVEHGFVTSRELFPLVRHHYESIIFDTFSWRDGSWKWSEDEPARGERILLDVRTPTLIVEGMRSRVSDEDIDKLVSSSASPLRLPTGVCAVEDTGLLPEEIVLYEACDGDAAVSDLAERFDVPERELLGLLAGMKVLRLVDLDNAFVQPGSPARRRASPAAPSDETTVDRARVADKMQTADEGSYFALLEVGPDASGYEIRKAYRRLRSQFSMERYAIAGLGDLEPSLNLIRQVLDEAYEVLRDPALRESYKKMSAER